MQFPRHLLALVFGAVCTAPTLVFADNQADTIEACFSAIDSGDTEAFETLAEQIKTWRFLFDPATVRNAERCLSEGYGESWRYDLVDAGFVNSDELERRRVQAIKDDEDEAYALLRARCDLEAGLEEARAELSRYEDIQALAKAEEDRVEAELLDEVGSAVVSECNEWILEDRRSALTNNVCLDVFSRVGLPESAVAKYDGPTSDEVSEAIFESMMLEVEIVRLETAIELINLTNEIPDNQGAEVHTSANGNQTTIELNDCEQLR